MLKYVALLAVLIGTVTVGCKPVNPLPDPFPTDAPITVQVPR